MNIIGIDPGATGALAAITPAGGLQVIPFRPLYHRDRGTLTRQIVETLRSLTPCVVYMELVHAMPRDGKRSSFAFGEANAFIRTTLEFLELHTTFVPPQTWQQFLGLGRRFPSTKERKIAHHALAVTLYPRNKDINKATADAVLIAEYGWRQIHGSTSV